VETNPLRNSRPRLIRTDEPTGSERFVCSRSLLPIGWKDRPCLRKLTETAAALAPLDKDRQSLPLPSGSSFLIKIF